MNAVAFMQISTLTKILQLAKQGLPIVLVGNGPIASAGLNTSADGNATNDDSKITALLSELKNHERCLSVDDVGQIPNALKRINIL